MNGISIIIPTYKRSISLREAVLSLIKQKCDIPFEIILIDQNLKGYLSSTLSESIISNCKIIHQDKPNVSLARNNGFKNSTYNILLFMDDDLIAPSNFLDIASKILINNTYVFCLSPLVYNYGKKTDEIQNKLNDVIDKKEKLYQISNPISAAFFIYKDTYYKIGGFDPYLFDYCKSTEDNEFFIRLQKHGEKIYFDPLLEILHTEEVEGGCELRKGTFIQNRFKFIKGWTYRYRIHNGKNLKLTISDFYNLVRSVVLNKNLLHYSIKNNFQLIRFLMIAINDSKSELSKNNLHFYYQLGWKTNHLKY